MKIALLAITSQGKTLAAELATHLNNEAGTNLSATPLADGPIKERLAAHWHYYQAFICIMATGIAVRAIAPLLADKKSDPCVIVLDEKGRHAISLLSGHLGGGNSLARKLAAITGGEAVITTSSDTQELVPLDLWAARHNLLPAQPRMMTLASSLLVNRGILRIFSELPVTTLPAGIVLRERKDADLLIQHTPPLQEQLVLHPQHLVIGVGCNRNTPMEEFQEALQTLLSELQISPLCLRNLASIDAKKDEVGLLLFAKKQNLPISFFSAEQINAVHGITPSHAAMKAVGARGVAEPTALLSAQTTTLLYRKRKWKNITMAVAAAPCTLSAQVRDPLTI